MTNRNPLVSIIVPTYNQEQYIQTAINSCLKQTYDNLEIIISDDCSTDQTKSICEEIIKYNPRVKYYRVEKNIGQVENYRYSLYHLAKGDWVINLDGDDYFSNENFISYAIEQIKIIGEDKVVLFQGAHIYKDQDQEKIYTANIDSYILTMPGKKYFLNFFKFNHFSHLATLYNRKKALPVDFYKNKISSTDIESFLKLSIINRNEIVILSKEIAGVWLQHSTNISRTLRLKQVLLNSLLYFRMFKLYIRKEKFSLAIVKWSISALFFNLKAIIKNILTKLTRKKKRNH